MSEIEKGQRAANPLQVWFLVVGAICLVFAVIVAMLGLTARVNGPESVVDMRSTAVLAFLAMSAVCFGLATFIHLKH